MLYDSTYIKVQNYTILSEIKTEVIIRDVRGGSNWQKHKKGGGSFEGFRYILFSDLDYDYICYTAIKRFLNIELTPPIYVYFYTSTTVVICYELYKTYIKNKNVKIME